MSNNDDNNDEQELFFWWVLKITFHNDEAMVLVMHFY